MTDEQIKRINELAKKKKESGLTAAETEEQQRLRREYIDSFRESLRSQLSSLAEQTQDSFTWTTTQIKELVENVEAGDSATEEQLKLIQDYMKFTDGTLSIGKTGNPFTFRVMNERLAFYMNDSEVAYLSNNKLYVTQAEILTRLQIGKFAFEPQTNGNMSIVYTG